MNAGVVCLAHTVAGASLTRVCDPDSGAVPAWARPAGFAYGAEHVARIRRREQARTSNSLAPNERLGRLLVGYLENRGLTLEACLPSHPHVDHAGALATILSRKVLVPGASAEDRDSACASLA